MRLTIEGIICAALLSVCAVANTWADDMGEYPHWDYKLGLEERFRYEYKQEPLQ